MNVPKEVLGLWVALTIPVLIIGAILYFKIETVHPGVVTQYVEVTPTATPSASIVPSFPVASPTAALKSVAPTVKGGVR